MCYGVYPSYSLVHDDLPAMDNDDYQRYEQIIKFMVMVWLF